jgi:sugar/nucleoside kinase (ribokinase family)
MFDVLIAGNYSVDLIFTGLPQFPELGKDIVGNGFNMTPGEAYIHAVAMHRLGIKVGWAADFGNDDFSLFALQRVRNEGLDESLFIHHNRPLRRISVAVSFPEDRAFITYYDPDPPIPAAFKALTRVSAMVMYIPGLFYGPTFEVGLKLIRARHMKLIMDGNSTTGDIFSNSKDSHAIRKAIQNTSIFLPNASEARRLTGKTDLEAAMRALADLCPLVVVKDGHQGAYACSEGSIMHAASIPVTPIDTTGAGDNFNAGFLKAWLDGQNLLECLRWGNVVGALSTTALGGTTRRITPDLVEKMLAEIPVISTRS